MDEPRTAKPSLAHQLMTHALSRTIDPNGNPVPSILTASSYEPPSESPDSIRLLGPLWTASGLTLQEPCRVYAGDHWNTGRLVATGETCALVKTSAGLARCEDRRNLQTSDEALLFKRHQTQWRRERKAALQGGRNNG